jgi:hypothetical protein
MDLSQKGPSKTARGGQPFSVSPLDFTRGLEELNRLRIASPSTLLATVSLLNGLPNDVPVGRKFHGAGLPGCGERD